MSAGVNGKRSSGRAPLSNAHQEAADAIWQLNRTMRSQIAVIVPSHASQQRIEPPVQALEPATPPGRASTDSGHGHTARIAS